MESDHTRTICDPSEVGLAPVAAHGARAWRAAEPGKDLFLLRDGLTRMLQAHGLEVTAAVDNGPDLLAAVAKDQPDVAIVDVRLPPTFTD
jgi:CheY-like chemotaxis protein